MTWTRTERAALDYVIAKLADRRWSLYAVDSDMPEVARRAQIRCQQAVRLDGAAERPAFARLALYLRLLRRVEAWEREDAEWGKWSDFEAYSLDSEPAREGEMNEHGTFPVGPSQWEYNDRLRAWPWHPLWLDAPPHDPAVTPRMRREAKR